MKIEKPAGVEINTNNSLMKKTKAQLVEIILRKDDIEKKLRDKNKELEADNIKFANDTCIQEANLTKKNAEYDKLRREYEEECDYNAEYVCFLNNRIKAIKIFAAISTCVAIVAISMILIIFTL